MPSPRSHHGMPRTRAQRGVSLVIVLMILVIVSILGVSGIQISLLGERSARNDRDAQIAWQAGESALLDAEFDIEGQPAASSAKRNGIFAPGKTDIAKFATGCGTSGQSRGLCALNLGEKPAWLTVDFTATGNSAPTTPFGTFTGRTFPSGAKGMQPTKPPRYVIEAIPDPETVRTANPGDAQSKYIYRITAMGFGPNAETQAVLQTLYRN